MADSNTATYSAERNNNDVDLKSVPTAMPSSSLRAPAAGSGVCAVVVEERGALDEDWSAHHDDKVLVCRKYANSSRWRSGERLEQLFENRCDRLRDSNQRDQIAVDIGSASVTYDQLDMRANQLARCLLDRGVRAGDRIGLLFDQPLDAYVGMLAVLKVYAVYVPLDVGFPLDRIAYIVRDAQVQMVLSLSHVRKGREHIAKFVCIDEMSTQIDRQDGHRLTSAEKGAPTDDLCYVIYTSGSTGQPKGVAVEHASICNFVQVASEVYGIKSGDRAYQGMTIAFDFSVEEIWVPWAVGATLVPKPGGISLLGYELGDFLKTNSVTVLCCVPTLLATLDADLPDLRFLLVSGEACPQDLIARWHRPGRRFLNVYGPTEATVTATWTTVRPNQPVTIGVPLPTYSVVILDPVEPKILDRGKIGEIGVAGIGLARGYLNRDDLTNRAFIQDFVGIANNPSGRIYRTGDLGSINADGEIVYHGRIDTQVKIRGYRIELTEIESVLLGVEGIAQAVVDTYEPEPGIVELAAYYSLHETASDVDRENIYRQLRQRLPSYMIPAYLDKLDAIPMTTSNKADRGRLPAPSSQRSLTSNSDYAGPDTELEKSLADTLATVIGVDRVSVDSDFFSDLATNSLLMAHFCAALRDQNSLPPVSMKDIYLHPTIRGLAATLSEASNTASSRTVPAPAPAAAAIEPISTLRYVICGALQLLLFLGYVLVDSITIDKAIEWIGYANGVLEIYLRSIVAGGGGFLVLCAIPVAAKWLLIGRWKAQQEIRVWTLPYVRFWVVKSLIRFNPMRLFVGSPLYVAYLRMLGASIGKNVAIFSQHVPICTDLITIGDGAVIRKDCFFNGYRAQAGRIITGRITLGAHVLVGEATVLDIETRLGDHAQLGHTSCLHANRTVPDGQHWHGSPAEPTDVDYQSVRPTKCGRHERIRYSVLQLLTMATVYLPLILIGTEAADVWLNSLSIAPSGWESLRDLLTWSLAAFIGLHLAGLVIVLTVPRLLNAALVPNRVYPLYGLHYTIQRAITRLTNMAPFTYLFGDSCYIVHYLRGLGYNLSDIQQTGSNFGVEVKHETPFMSAIGSGTMISDGLSIINADFSNTSFRVRKASIGPRNFVGNNVTYPSGGRTGANCLLATKAMIPLDGPVRQNTGLLGSPCFPIPRSVHRDSQFEGVMSGTRLTTGVAAKTRHNTVTMVLYLLAQWIHFVGVVLLALTADILYDRFGAPVVAADVVATLTFTITYWSVLERAALGFRALKPQVCSIYNLVFWRHERFWKLGAGRYLTPLNGTPFKNVAWRALGVRIGRRVFDDGCSMPERTLVSIGDDCTLNEGCTIHPHTLEDAVFKSDYVAIGDGCTIGTNAFIDYGVIAGAGSTVDPDSFLMKGTRIAPNAHWRGNPATEVPTF